MLRSVAPSVFASAFAVAVAASCAACGPAFAADGSGPSGFGLVESAPLETTLDHEDIPETDVVWVEMIAAAKKTIDIGNFYVTTVPGSPLERVIDAIAAAAARGIKVRFLVDRMYYEQYKDTYDRIAAIPGVELRNSETWRWMKGVLHAKYMIVDGLDVFLGSQNFDWRAMDHIQELGVRLQDPAIAAVIRDVFELDWTMGKGGVGPEAAAPFRGKTYPLPARVGEGGDALLVTPALSPEGWLPDEKLWDLPRILELIGAAKESIIVQLMSYSTIAYDKSYWPDLDIALRGAAARGVKVELMVSDWGRRPGQIEGLQSLEPLANVTVKLVTIPPWSGGFVDHGRVIHSKFMVVDGRHSWVGSSNWSKDYFFTSRNLGVFVEGEAFAERLDAFFRDLWDSHYAEQVDPGRTYEEPRIKE